MNTPASDPPLVQACLGNPPPHVPVWFMRQAGRYNPRHRALFERHGVRGITTDPELNARVTVLPVEELGVDAAVMYADILLPLEDMGVGFRYGPGDTGPVFENPIRSPGDVERLRTLEPERGVSYILEAIRRVREELPPSVPLIGFSGGPFTLAAYMIEGEASRTFTTTKRFMLTHPRSFHRVMERLTEGIVRYFDAQLDAGIQVAQLFESWMGVLGPRHYEQFVRPYVGRIFEHLGAYPQPTIFFGTGTAGLLRQQIDAGADVLGVDWRVDLAELAHRRGTDRVVMGNLEPAAVLSPWDRLRREARTVLDDADRFRAHVFNLGHRVPNDASVDRLRRLVAFVHEETSS